MTHCQTACQIHEDCNFFTFLKDEHVCKLHALDFDNRVCDIIHGLPTRTFQSCLDENKIPRAHSVRCMHAVIGKFTNLHFGILKKLEVLGLKGLKVHQCKLYQKYRFQGISSF